MTLIILFGCIVWTSWRFWRILPFPIWGKWLSVSVYILAFLVIFPHFMCGDRMPMPLATATYEIGTSWMIFFLYALIITLVIGAVILILKVIFYSILSVVLWIIFSISDLVKKRKKAVRQRR